MLFPAQADSFNRTANRFEAYSKKRINRARAIIVKICQKLAQPQVGEME